MATTPLLLLASLLLAGAAADDCAKSDRAALMAIKSAFGNPPGLYSWNSTTPCCSFGFLGVGCNQANRVSSLSVFALNITATIPPAVAQLTELETINFPYNNLHGPIPDFLGPTTLKKLSFLRLDGNNLSGAIPASLTVSNLLLRDNQLTGTFPPSFASFNFGEIDVSNNMMTGDASLLFGENKTNLFALWLSNNSFAFNLSAVQLPKGQLRYLVIDHNQIYGGIPAAAAEPDRRWLRFDVSYNRLCGPIPQGPYTTHFGSKHFSHNLCLCGRPLPPCK